MEVKKIVEGMTAPQVAQVIDDNFKAQNAILEEDIAKQNNVIGVSEYKDFSEAEAVNVGDVRKYDGLLYECVEATTGAFDASKWKKSSFKAETEKKLSELGSYVENPEYICVYTDAEGRFLWGIKHDGSIEWAKGIPTPIKKIISQIKKNVALLVDKNDRYLLEESNEEFIRVVTDSDGNIIYSISKDGTVNIPKLRTFRKIEGKADIIALHPYERVMPILNNMKFGKEKPVNGEDSIPLSLLWFSDIHISYENIERINEFYKNYCSVLDGALCTGDSITNYQEDWENFWGPYGNTIMLTIGNHEVAGVQPVSAKMCYDRFFAPFADKLMITIEPNKSYWYKDYTSNTSANATGGIRLIALAPYHWKEKIYQDGNEQSTYPDGTSVDKGEQEEWFKNLLSDAIQNDMAVVCAVHNPITTRVDRINCTFDIREYNNTEDKGNPEMYACVQSFIENGGHFVAWLTGHMHQDRFALIQDYPQQLQITIGQASYLINWRSDAMTKGTTSMDKFNIVNINTMKKQIRMYRVGADTDRDLRHMGLITYDYGKKELIFNN